MIARKTGQRGAKESTWTLLKLVQPDYALSRITGSNPRPLGELINRLWAYIRRNGLQDARCRAVIHADELLRALFNGKGQVTVFEMIHLVSTHTVSGEM